MNDDYIMIFITTANEKEADNIVKILLQNKLIACANVIKNIKSHFWWKAKMEKAEEIMIVCKSKKQLLSSIIETVKKHHSYEVPEIIALDIVGGNNDYLTWIDESIV